MPVPAATMWPGDRTAAISLTFDDAMATQLDNAGPILKKYGIHGTFFVITGAQDWQKRVADWKRLSSEGNEIGGHTVNQPCMRPQVKPHSQDYTPAMMEAETRDSAQAIMAETGERRGLTFAYPCGNMSFGFPAEQSRNAALYQRCISEHSLGILRLCGALCWACTGVSGGQCTDCDPVARAFISGYLRPFPPS